MTEHTKGGEKDCGKMEITCVLAVKFGDDYVIVNGRSPRGIWTQEGWNLDEALGSIFVLLSYYKGETPSSEIRGGKKGAHKLIQEIAEDAFGKIVEGLS